MNKYLFSILIACSLASCRNLEPLPQPRQLRDLGSNTVSGINSNTILGQNTLNTLIGSNLSTAGFNTTTGTNSSTHHHTDIKPLEATTLVSHTVTNLDAGSANGQANNIVGHFVFFSLRTNSVVAIADSATTQWDIGFRGTTIIFNSGTSGPGTAGVIIQNGIFEDISQAPQSGYKQDNSKGLPPYAVPTGSRNGWYNYNSSTNVISAIPGRVLIIRTANNKYAKLEILNYYKDAPANPTSGTEARFYKFQYSFQGDGSRLLK